MSYDEDGDIRYVPWNDGGHWSVADPFTREIIRQGMTADVDEVVAEVLRRRKHKPLYEMGLVLLDIARAEAFYPIDDAYEMAEDSLMAKDPSGDIRVSSYRVRRLCRTSVRWELFHALMYWMEHK